MSGRRGYTMTELMVATTISVVACLGGLSAVRIGSGATARAELARASGDAIRRLEDARALAPLRRCDLGRLLGPGGSPASCAEVFERAGRQPFTQAGELPGKVGWQLTYALDATVPALLRVDARFHSTAGEVRHALLVHR
ncbi:MAG: type II secretion system protein [Deltaproteobacteria bacterium]|nr:type II secretion system protein [Deltaproteobacteria bacterium]